MKLKTLGRIVGVVDAAVWSYVGYWDYRILSSYDYNKFGEFFTGDYPLEHRAIAGTLIGLEAISVPVIVVAITDGLVDIAKGTHHYFGMKVWQRLTRNQQRKEQIDKEIGQMFESIERPISYKARE